MSQSGEKPFEIALVGDFQCGKSTLFDALCGGRDIAPRGEGVKTSACAVSVCTSTDDTEYAEVEWYSPDELHDKLNVVQTLLKNGSDEIEFNRLDKIIKAFESTSGFASLRKLKRMSILSATKALSYPVDWETRWATNKKCGGFSSARDVAFLFMKRVVFHLDILLPFDCVFTDTPGFNAGGWDFSTAQEIMRRADVVCCIMNGREKAIASSYFRALDWVKREGIASKLFFAVNASSLAKGKSFISTNKAEIKKRGFVLNQGTVPVFSALLSYMAKAKGLSKGEIGTAISKWLDLDIWDDVKEIEDFCSSKKKIEHVSNVAEVLSELDSFSKEIRKHPPVQCVANEGLVNSPRGLVPDSGYDWINPNDPNDMRVKWIPGKPMPNNPHVLAGTKPRNWVTDEGYSWASDAEGDFRVVWTPDRPHSSNQNILAGQKEGTWCPRAGYDWIDPRNMDTKISKGVRWCPWRAHPYLHGVVAAPDEENAWMPKEGYKWADETSVETKFRYGAVWAPGRAHSSISHVIAAIKEGDWDPEPGYQWKDYWTWYIEDKKPTVQQKLKCGVEWSPGKENPNHPHVVAAAKEGVWEAAKGWKWLDPSASNDLRVVECNIVEKGIVAAGDFVADGLKEIGSFLDDLFG